MVDKLMCIPNDDTQNTPIDNWWLEILDTQPTNQNSVKVPKVDMPMNVIIKLWVLLSPLSQHKCPCFLNPSPPILIY